METVSVPIITGYVDQAGMCFSRINRKNQLDLVSDFR
jgi:hypothetical protein